jgi:hypothetical protein
MGWKPVRAVVLIIQLPDPHMQAQEIFSVYVENYLEEMGGFSYAALRGRQAGLFANLAFGAAGISYAFWYAALLTRDDRHLDTAERWLRSALRAQHGPLAFVGPPGDRHCIPRFAYLYGRAGLCFMRALMADSRGNRRPRNAAIASFIAESRPSLDGISDLYSGSAGCLSGAAILFRRIGDPRLRPLGEQLALHQESVLERQSRLGPRKDPGLAHGTAGIYLSLLLWAMAAATPPTDRLSRRLKAFLRDSLRESSRFCREANRSWLCSGFAGLALLAVKAHQALGDSWFLSAARRAAELALTRPSMRPDLCCGRAGTAYACLALAGAEPQGPWRKHAEELTLSALLVDSEDWPMVGLYGGEAALPCLALSLLSGITSGPPCLDFVEKEG